MKKQGLLLLLFVAHHLCFGQTVDTTYTSVPEDFAVQQAGKKDGKNTSYGSLGELVFKEVMGYYKDKKAYEREREQNIAKLAILQRTWQDTENKPDTITDGWHNAVATDNVNFYKVAKALVQGNKVKKVVIDNYMPLSFLSTNAITKCRTTLTLEGMNNEALEIAELYFLYDLGEPTLVAEPLHPGFVCLWSDYLGQMRQDINLKIDGVLYKKPFEQRIVGEHDCFSENMLCLILKPGVHELLIDYPGPAESLRTFTIKPDMCLHYRIGEKKRAKN